MARRGPNGRIAKKPGKKRHPVSYSERQPTESAPDRVSLSLTPWPIVECRINAEWKQQGMASIVLLQQDPRTGTYTFTAFLVDVLGLGLKDGFSRHFVSRRHLTQQLERMHERHRHDEDPPPEYVTCSLDLLRQLVWGGILWARQHDFQTPRIAVEVAEKVLGQMPDEPAALDLSIFGQDDGRPLLIGSFESIAPFLRQQK